MASMVVYGSNDFVSKFDGQHDSRNTVEKRLTSRFGRVTWVATWDHSARVTLHIIASVREHMCGFVD